MLAIRPFADIMQAENKELDVTGNGANFAPIPLTAEELMHRRAEQQLADIETNQQEGGLRSIGGTHMEGTAIIFPLIEEAYIYTDATGTDQVVVAQLDTSDNTSPTYRIIAGPVSENGSKYATRRPEAQHHMVRRTRFDPAVTITRIGKANSPRVALHDAANGDRCFTLFGASAKVTQIVRMLTGTDTCQEEA